MGLDVKPVSNLLEMNFFIPAYQRGYRWTDQQVKELLEDIYKFRPKNEEWYCLQPIVVKEREKGEWEVIDGQQRLTTIFLIIHYFNEMWIGKQKISEPEIKYETRDASFKFLKEMSVGEDDHVLITSENIDFWHISKAYETIHEWVKTKKHFDNNNFQSMFKEKTKVIWYETVESDTEQIFTRINSGKIRLTNAELIKALFLNSSNFKTNNAADEDKIRLKQLEIASEWDFIEYSLHNDEFWLFVNKDENEKDTRIEFLFELLVGKPENKDDDTYTFRKYSDKFKDHSEKEIGDNWKEIKRYFQILQDWFDDRVLYHKIGYLVTIGEDIKELIKEYQSNTKESFLVSINEKITSKFTNIQLDEIEKGNGNIRSILLLHNIQTMLNNKKENSRFPFNRYKKEKWDIEHIHAIASEAKVKDDIEEQKRWLKDNYEENDSNKNEDLEKRIDALLKGGATTKDENFQEIIEYVLGEEDNRLRNLCLLDEGTNRAYKNDSFKKKRKKIIEREKKGTFIPICTRNVFMKYYSEELIQLGQWSEKDREAYLNDIKDILTRLREQYDGSQIKKEG